jgi:transposase
MPLTRQKGFRIETKTLTSKLSREGFDLSETNQAFSDVTLFFLCIIAEDPMGVDSADIKRYYEPRFFGDEADQLFPFDCPQTFRRAALSKAAGLYKSWRSNYGNWQAREEKRKARKRGKPLKSHKPPVVPTHLKINTTFYKGMFKDDDGMSVMLKILVDGQWKWIKFHYSCASNLSSDWVKSSPSLVLKQGTAYLNWTVERYQPATGGIKTLMQDGNRICAVDTDLDGELMKAVVLDVDADGNVIELSRMTTSGHNSHVKRRKSRLGKIAVRMKQTGVIIQGFASNRWAKIRRSEVDAGNQISAQLVDFAQRWGCAVIVFEALKSLKPQRGKYSRRSNKKRAYWLKSRVMKETSRKARQNHNILTAYVSPKDTSRFCAYDGHPVWRGNTYMPTMLQLMEPYSCGGLCFVAVTGYRGNAGFNASRNIGLRFYQRYYESPKLVKVGFGEIASKLPAQVIQSYQRNV